VLPPASRIQVDPGRIAAGVVTGIGFLRAGAIIRIGDFVRGLTTAGCIWFVAALGITIGQGLYALAIVSTGLALAVLLPLTHVERHIQPIVYRSIVVIAALA
jgi:putative Mg2+ transporter-C (MgtC) family protein